MAGRTGSFNMVSAGLSAVEESAMCPVAAERITGLRGGAEYVANFRSQSLQSMAPDSFDMVLTATTEQRSEFVTRHPHLRGRTFTALEAVFLSALAVSDAELVELRVNGLAAVFTSRRGLVETQPARSSARWRNHHDVLDISDGHNNRRNRHHLATVDMAARTGASLAELMLQWQVAAETTES